MWLYMCMHIQYVCLCTCRPRTSISKAVLCKWVCMCRPHAELGILIVHLSSCAHACVCVCMHMHVCVTDSSLHCCPLQLDEGIRNVLCIPIYSNDEEVIGKQCMVKGDSAYSNNIIQTGIHRCTLSLMVSPTWCVHMHYTGVAQMANKANGLPFTTADQESLEVCILLYNIRTSVMWTIHTVCTYWHYRI